jgi:DNA-directed RNA polymerase subunit RPC12/RpoP
MDKNTTHYRPGEWVQGKLVLKVFLNTIGEEIKCPYCGIINNTENAIQKCAGCGRKWFKKLNGDYVFCA